MQWNQIDPVHMHITPRIERVLIKVKVFWYAGAVGSQMVVLKKTVLHHTNGASLAFCSTMYVQLDFQENHFFLESVTFHHEMFGV